MKDCWKRFILVKLPITLLVVVMVVEALAFVLEKVRPNRHDLDRLAMLADRSHATIIPSILVFGDSVTQDVLKTFKIGFEGQVANLTTNKASGLIGSYLLLKRYLQNYSAPKTVIFASSPEFFAFFPTGDVADIYLKSVFYHMDEQSYIQNYLNERKVSASLSLLNLKERIGSKIIALLTPTPTRFPMGQRVPNDETATEDATVQAVVLKDILTRAERSIAIPSQNSEVFSDICSLAKKHNFNIHVIFAPVPKSIHKAWEKNQAYASFEIQLRELVNSGCQNATVSLHGILATVPDSMMRDGDHLVRHRGTNFYAAKLGEFTAGLMSSF